MQIFQLSYEFSGYIVFVHSVLEFLLIIKFEINEIKKSNRNFLIRDFMINKRDILIRLASKGHNLYIKITLIYYPNT